MEFKSLSHGWVDLLLWLFFVNFFPNSLTYYNDAPSKYSRGSLNWMIGTGSQSSLELWSSQMKPITLI